MHRTVGKVKLFREGDTPKKVDLWATFGSNKGYLQVKDVLQALEWDHVYYVDDKGFEIPICAHDHGKLQGFSTDTFERDQTLFVHGRKLAGQRSQLGALINSITYHGTAAGQDIDMETSLLEENEDFSKIMVLFDQVVMTTREMKKLMESLSKTSVV
eukprot:c12291_g1_i1 orf=219-689(+)